MTFSSRLVEFSSELSFDRLPGPTIEGTKNRFLDFLGVALAARNDPAAKAIGSFAAGSSAQGRSVSFADGRLLVPSAAALVNGAMGHCLELDDEHHESTCHIGAVVVPAALSCAEHGAAPGSELLLGLVAGYEAAARIGKCIVPGVLLRRGFHPTGVVGVFGATLAACRLLRLRPAESESAFGIAGSLASGIFEFVADGTLTKRLHPGWAAQGGVTAAILAQNGLTGPASVLEGKHGFFRAFAGEDSWNEEEALEGLGDRYEIDASAYKPYACCSYIHPAIDAALKVRLHPAFSLDGIGSIEIVVHPETLHVIAEPRESKIHPHSIVDAQFSVYFAVAAALKYGSRRRSDTLKRFFIREVIADADLRRLADRSSCIGKDSYRDYFPRQYPAEVRVRLNDGRILSEFVPTHIGDPSDPAFSFRPKDIEERFLDLTSPLLSSDIQRQIIEFVGSVEHQPGIEPLTAALRRSFDPP